MMDLQGQLLIAMPHLDDYFYRSVVFICEHNDKGSMGLVLNTPTDLSVAELYSKMNFMTLNNRTFPDDLVLAGGPVSTDRGFILHKKTEQEFEHSYVVSEELCLTTSADVINTFGSIYEPEKYLVALGCASWQQGQLENEIINNMWLVVPANDAILFDLPYEDRYLAANQLLGIEPSALVSYQMGRS